jgi:hypothetical protein
MAAITKASIITDVNANLNTAFATTELDTAIIKTLRDMSNKKLLVGTDATQTLSDGSKTLNHPTGFNSIISITLIDGSGNEQKPLKKLPGGHKEYRQLRHNDDASGITEWFSDFDKKFYLWRPADDSYTTLIEYYKNHAKTADSIEFTDELENLMFAGATYYHAIQKGRTNAISIWAAEYDRQLKMVTKNIQPVIVGE